MATVDSESFDDAHIAVVSLESGKRKKLVEGATYPRYPPSGHLVYARNGNLLAVRFDPRRLEVTGQPFTVLEGVLMSRNTGVANFDIAASGDLAYIPGIAKEAREHWSGSIAAVKATKCRCSRARTSTRGFRRMAASSPLKSKGRITTSMCMTSRTVFYQTSPMMA